MNDDLLLSPEDVAEIVAILDASGYAQLDLKTGRFRLRLDRAATGWTQEWRLDDAVDDTRVSTDEPSATAVIPEGLVAITAPLPGTFYHQPQPGAPPFVAVGDVVEPDTVVGIVETMKLMNPVHAGTSGTVATVVTGNAVMVGIGDVLMHVRPNAA